MSDNVANADQQDCMDLFDWDSYEWGGVIEMMDDCFGFPFGLDAADDAVAHLIDDNLVGYAKPWTSNPAELTSDPWFINHFGQSNPSDSGIYEGVHNNLSTDSLYGDTRSQFRQDVMQPPIAVVKNQPRESLITTRSEGNAGTHDAVRNLADATDLTCSYPDCTYKKPFSGAWELNRHMKGRHLGEKTFVCPAVGCFKKRDRTAFARMDKLTSHFRSKHDYDTIVECPHETCKAAGLVSHCDLMATHLQLHGLGRSGKSKNVGNLLIEANEDRKCPLWGCKARLGPWELVNHIKDHTFLEIQPQADDLRCLNFVLFADKSAQSASHQGPAFTLKALCPACPMICDDYVEFLRHFFNVHLAADRDYPLKPSFAANASNMGYQYAYTSLMDVAGQQMRNDLSDLIPYRRKIMRLIPQCTTDFRWKSIWSDLLWKATEVA